MTVITGRFEIINIKSVGFIIYVEMKTLEEMMMSVWILIYIERMRITMMMMMMMMMMRMMMMMMMMIIIIIITIL